MSTRFAHAALMLALLAPAVQAAPRIPSRADEVIERLPRRADPVQQELRQLRAQLAANPRDLALATGVAQRYIVRARAETDPRYLGYAQAALAPWWNSAAPPREVRLLRATLLQSTHHFPEAMRDLDAVVAADPRNAQAWLTRATVQTVRGEYAAASASCARLSSLASELVSIGCIANVAGMNGRAAKGEALLEATLRRAGDVDPDMQAWVLTLLAEMATRRGDAALAERRFTRALALAPRDSYLIGAYADFLLDQRRPREVLPLVRDQSRIDALLLRFALALQQIPGEQDALRRADDELKARFAAAMQRGDSVHQREQARYELTLHADSKAALALAQKNWAVQKESADMRVLLEAALKAGDKPAAAPVLEWIRNNAVEDVALARLAKQIGAGT
jgi:Tfp pilus assembly protein PilF